MIKRTLYFGNPARLSLANNQIRIELPAEAAGQPIIKTAPVEDIGFIILDHPQITLTHALLQFIQYHCVGLISCDQRHMPVGLMLPLEGNILLHERYSHQLTASLPLKKQLWAQVISAKIFNQFKVLQFLNISASELIPLYQNVKSGDTENNEARAAAIYWNRIFPAIPGFTRTRDGLHPNPLLNYGYAILRAITARAIVAAGLLPTQGIHHSNRYNAYCLADDLMEPFRPYIDLQVLSALKLFPGLTELTRDVKAHILSVQSVDVSIQDEISPLTNAVQRTVNSLVKCFLGEQRNLVLPVLS